MDIATGDAGRIQRRQDYPIMQQANPIVPVISRLRVQTCAWPRANR